MGAWTLHLKFNGDNTDYYSGILDGAVIKECVGAKGKHAMQSCSVSIWDSILAAKIFNSKDDIEAKIHNGDTVVFEGVIRPYARLSAQMAYENPIELEVIDYSQILRYYIYTDLSDLNLDLSDSAKEKIIETKVYENIGLSTLIRNLFTLGKIDKKVSIEIPEIDIRKDYFCLEAGEYLDDIIAELLYEYCLDYRFTPGKLTVFSTKVVDKDKKAIEPTETLSDFNLTFEVSRADQSEDGVKVNYGIYRVKRMQLYSVDTRFDNYFDNWLWESWHLSGYYYNHAMNKTLDNLPKVSWSFGENMSNNTILNISDIECKAGLQDERGVWYQGFCKEYDKDGGKPYIQYDGQFDKWFGKGWGFTMEVYGLVFYRMKEDASTELVGLSPTNISTDYIESADDAGILAINIQARNEKAAYTYGFTSWTKIAPGTIVALEENKVTGLSATVRIISRTLDPKTGLYTYEAEGAGEVTIPELFSQSRGDNGSIIDSDGRSYIIDIELSKDMIVSSKDKVTATASGMLFSSYGCTPHWELNGEALSDTELSITLKATQLQVGDNTLRCYAEYEGETIEKSVTIMLVSAESKYLDYDLSSWIVRCYADGYVMDDTPIMLTARSVESISLYINDNLITSGNPISYSITPSDYMDNERAYIKIRLVAGNVTRSTRIMRSLLSGELELTTDKNEIDFYADDIEVEDGAEITVTAKATNFKDYPTLISWNGSIEKGTSDTIVEKIPASVLRGRSSITVTAKIGTLVRTIAISKNTLQGSIDITADKTVLNYYADDIEKTVGDKITVKAVATNYKASPTIEMDGTAVATGSSGSAAYDVLATSLYGKSGAVITAKVGDISKSIAITKSYEQGTISIECDRPVFDYYADNVPHNSTDISTLTIKQSGYSKMPALYINGTETEYQSKNANGEGSGTYSVKATELINLSALTAKIQILEEVQLLALTKKLDSPMIRLSVSEPVAEYYYDNVSITNDIEAEVSYSGLFYAPLLKAGNTPIQLSDEGKGIIPISLFDDVDSGLSVMAYAQKNITYGTSVSIQKQKRQLKLSLGISGAQFTYDNNGNASPEYISITNNTEGLSDKSKVLLLVGGESKSWDESGAYKITPDMITGRYIAVSIGYGSDTTTAIITKTYDGKAEDYQYSKTKSFRIYPDDEYGFIYSDEFLEYNGERFAWVVPWSVKIPDVSSNEYLWRRSRTDEDSDWQYTRITGIKGEDGENAGGEYLGHYTSAPTKRPDGNDLENGDYYLDTSKDGEPLPYRYKDGGWVLITSSDPDWSVIASNTMNDVNNYAGSLLSTSAYYGYFQLLSAQKAFIKSLGTQEITLTDGGSIMSENYKSSNGAEGFRIDSDGNVDFNEGTFRGSFANGLSFIPPTNCIIYKNDTQREAYQKMKKAMIGPGVYRTGSMWSYTKTGTLPEGYKAASGSYNNPTALRTGNGFWCSDIDSGSLSSNTILLHDFGKVIPLTPKYFLGFKLEDGEIKAYLFTKDMLEKAQFASSNTSDTFLPVDASSLTIYPQERLSQFVSKASDSLWLFYFTVVDGKIIGYQSTTENPYAEFYLYTLDEDKMRIVKGDKLNFGSIKGSLTRWYIPSFIYHEKTDASGTRYWECNLWRPESPSNFNNYSLMKTYDLINYELIENIDQDYTDGSVIVADMIRVGDRIFAQLISEDGQNPTGLARLTRSTGLGEWNQTTRKWDYVPDKQTQYTGSKDIEYLGLPGMVERDGIIYGTYSTHDFFSYDTNTNTYKDLSSIFRSGLVYQDNEMYNAISLLATPPIFARKTEYESDLTETGTLSDRIGRYNVGTKSYGTCDSLPAYVVAKIHNLYIRLDPISTSSSTSRAYGNKKTDYTLGITISKESGSTSYSGTYIRAEEEYKECIIEFYTASKATISYTDSKNLEYTEKGVKNTKTIDVSITNMDSTAYSLSGTIDEHTLYSTSQLWENNRILSIQWSNTKNKLIIGYVVSWTRENSFGTECILEYDIETGDAHLQSPVSAAVPNYSLAICPFAEDEEEFCFSGSYLFESKANDNNRKSFTIRNPYLIDLIPCVNDSVNNSIENALFVNPGAVPYYYRTILVQLIKMNIQGILQNNNAIELDGKKLFRIDDETIEYNCIIPYLNTRNMIIRDNSETYEIILGSAFSFYSYYVKDILPLYTSFSIEDEIMYRYFLQFSLMPNSNIEPLIRINKDSDEPVGATFIWDFPAQFTVREDINIVQRNRLFDESINQQLGMGD